MVYETRYVIVESNKSHKILSQSDIVFIYSIKHVYLLSRKFKYRYRNLYLLL